MLPMMSPATVCLAVSQTSLKMALHPPKSTLWRDRWLMALRECAETAGCGDCSIRAGTFPKKPHAGIHLSSIADDRTKLFPSVDAAHLFEQRIDLLGDLGAGVSIDAWPTGADVYTVASVA